MCKTERQGSRESVYPERVQGRGIGSRRRILKNSKKLLQNPLTISLKSCIIYTVVKTAIRESGGTGRRARLRGVWFTPYGFKSRFSHHSHSIKMQLCQKGLATQGFFDFLKASKHPVSTVQLFPSKRDLNPRHFLIVRLFPASYMIVVVE